MFRLVLRSLPGLPAVSPSGDYAVNPACLVRPYGLTCDIYVPVSRRQWIALGTALVFVGLFLAGGLLVHDEPVRWIPAVSSVVLAGLAFGVLTYGRKIASSRLYLVQPWEPFPLIDKLQIDNSLLFTWWQRIKRSSTRLNELTYHLTVRETEPNAAARLQGYANKKGNTVIEYFSTEGPLVDFLASDRYSGDKLVNAGRLLRGLASERRDLWPVARLIIARVLTHHAKTRPYPRFLQGDELVRQHRPTKAQQPHMRTANFYVTIKLHVMAVALWLLLVSLTIAAPSIYTTEDEQQLAALAMLPLPLFWAMHTFSTNRKILDRWRRWLRESGSRPLGHLPLYLYVTANEPQYGWEELDEHDFQVPLDDYIMETSAMFNIVVGTGTATLIAIFGFFAS